MSGIFDDIPDVIIGDIFDYLVSNNLKLCKQSNSNTEENLESEIIKVCNDLYEKLSEISTKGDSGNYFTQSMDPLLLDSGNLRWPNSNEIDNDIDFHMYLHLSSYFDQIQNGKLGTFEEEELFGGQDKASYLSVCLRNMKTAKSQEASLPDKRVCTSIGFLEKKPWDIFVIQDELIYHEMGIFGSILTQIFNSPRLFKVKESKNKRWPPDGPGSESTLIQLREVNLYPSSNENLEKIKVMQDEIQDLNHNLELLRLDYHKALSKSSVAEYKEIKSRNLKKTLLSLKRDKLELQKKLFNLVFNSQNGSFIDLFSSKTQHSFQVAIDLHNFNRAEAVNLVIFCIILILKYKFQTDLGKIFSKKNPNLDISERELGVSQKSFQGNFADIYFCVGLGNSNNSPDGNNDSSPKLASLIRRISFALNLNWRFGSLGFIIVRLQDNPDWYRFIQKFLE